MAMDIELKEITIREITKNYVDNDEEGVIGYGGKLNIRPKYQREFIYDENKRNAVINSIIHGFPLNVMYWIEKENGSFELLDGQQRTVSFCQYVDGKFSINEKYFHSLTLTEKEQILNYKLMIYWCKGNDKEILDWFEIINIAGEKLTDQELRNAVYTGTWLTHAKSIFSKSHCAAYLLSKDYVKGVAIRQEILEIAVKWKSKSEITDRNITDKIRAYMSIHQHDPNANELWTYFQNVINWVKLTFTTTREQMKGIDWGRLYDEFGTKTFDTDKLELEIQALMIDDDVTNKKGIYTYILTRDEKYLSIRAFTESQRRAAYEKQSGLCPKCGNTYVLKEMEADHITPWSKGGKTNSDNCQMLCRECNRRKSDI